jgi:hypothetical protein
MKAEQYRVSVRKGHFNWANSSEESISVHIEIPGWEILNLSVPVDYEYLAYEQRPWDTIVVDAVDAYLKRIWFSTDMSEVKRLKKWLEDDTNLDTLHDAWREYRRDELLRRRSLLDEELRRLGYDK